jgi:hypothetical protein
MSKQIDYKSASKFLRTLAGEDGSKEFLFQTFADRKADKASSLTRLLHGSLADCFDQLAERNGRGAGVFVTINATRGKGRKASNYDHPRAVWADLDGATVAKWPLEPSMIVETSPGKQHVYWLLAEDDIPLDTWRACMARIVERYGADRNATDPVRVLRLPGFLHCKGKPVIVRLLQCSGRRYSNAQVMKAFPSVKRAIKTAPKNTPVSGAVDIRELEAALQHLTQVPHPRSTQGQTYADDYDTWVRFGLAIKRGLGERGFRIWDDWAKTSSRYPGKVESRAKWDSFDVSARNTTDPITVGSVFHCARRHGWSFGRFRVIEGLKRGLAEIRAERGAA